MLFDITDPQLLQPERALRYVAEKYHVHVNTENQISLMVKKEQAVTARLIIVVTIKMKLNKCLSGEKYRS